MKRIATLIVSVLCFVGFMKAQNISVVSPSNVTTVYADFTEALNKAEAGSMVYLSEGLFTTNNYILSKKLHIIGIGYRSDSKNSFLNGGISFIKGSDGSSLIGVYVNGTVNIGSAQSGEYEVNNILIQNCSVSRIMQITPSWTIYGGEGMRIFQNIIRDAGSDLKIKNSFIVNNIFATESTSRVLTNTESTDVHNNIFFGTDPYYTNKSSSFENNIFLKGIPDFFVKDKDKIFTSFKNNISTNGQIIEGNFANVPANSIFTKWEGTAGYKESDDYRLAAGCVGKNAGTDGKDVGIYGGDGWTEKGIPFNPRIESAEIAPQTNADGTLNVKIKVSVREN